VSSQLAGLLGKPKRQEHGWPAAQGRARAHGLLLLKAGRDLREVQEFPGHAHVAKTQVYTHVLAEDLADAVDAMPDVEDEGKQPGKKPEETEAEKVARQLLENLPAEVRDALGRLSGE
jgi:hypothetical protein